MVSIISSDSRRGSQKTLNDPFNPSCICRTLSVALKVHHQPASHIFKLLFFLTHEPFFFFLQISTSRFNWKKRKPVEALVWHLEDWPIGTKLMYIFRSGRSVQSDWSSPSEDNYVVYHTERIHLRAERRLTSMWHRSRSHTTTREAKINTATPQSLLFSTQQYNKTTDLAETWSHLNFFFPRLDAAVMNHFNGGQTDSQQWNQRLMMIVSSCL